MEGYVIGALALLGAILIKLIAKQRAKKAEIKLGKRTISNATRLEPSANLPLSDLPVISYRSNRFILSKTEQTFYRVLLQGLGDQFFILTKVRVADILRPAKGLSKSAWQSAFNKISAKHFDFVLCSPNQFEIIAAIELDDSSHDRATRAKRDKFLNEACESASFPLIRITARQIYAVPEIKSAVLNSLRDYNINKAA